MRVAHAHEQIVVEVVAGLLQRVVKDDPVGAAGDRDAVEQIGQAEHRIHRRGSWRGYRRRR